jgi:hypothetical protein
MHCLRRSGGPAIQPCIAPSEASTASDRVPGRAWSVDSTAGIGRVLGADRGSSRAARFAGSTPPGHPRRGVSRITRIGQVLPSVLRRLVIGALKGITPVCHGELLDCRPLSLRTSFPRRPGSHGYSRMDAPAPNELNGLRRRSGSAFGLRFDHRTPCSPGQQLSRCDGYAARQGGVKAYGWGRRYRTDRVIGEHRAAVVIRAG